MKRTLSQVAAGLAVLMLSGFALAAADQHVLHSHVHTVVATLKPLGRLPSDRRLSLVIGLPLRNQAEFNLLLRELYNPGSPNFRRFLTPEQINAKFGPTEADYQAVRNFASSHGFRVDGTYDNRQMLDVSASVADIEKAFHVTLRTYQHPTEDRQFFAPDVEASIDASLPILDVSGLDNYVVPRPMLHKMLAKLDKGTSGGSGPGGTLAGYDFRSAYASNVSMTGTGQSIGLVQGDGFFANDLVNYENNYGLPNVPVHYIYVDSGYNSTTIPNQKDTNGVAECTADITMSICMAPGINAVYLFEGNVADHILGAMITNMQIKQFSTSWGMGQDNTVEQDFQIMQAQGQTFFTGCGDGDAYVNNNIFYPADDTNVISVGGTQLTLTGTGNSYVSETVWNTGFDSQGPWCCNGQNSNNAYWGSGGGVNSAYAIPPWQQSVNMTAVGGSSTLRNMPDVALTANNVWLIYDDGLAGGFMGTSLASPLWAGFTALINEQAANQGLTSVGFLNPAFYAIGEGSLYSSAFHDITNGNNTWPGSPDLYNAAPGYDLCTGWGTPNGMGLINALMNYGSAVWVDFNYNGATQNGTYDYPYETMAQATNAVPAGGNIWIRTAGSTSATMVITKPMTIHAYNGPGTIGN